MTLNPDEPTGLDDELATEPVGGPAGDAVAEQAEEESEEREGAPDLPLPPD